MKYLISLVVLSILVGCNPTMPSGGVDHHWSVTPIVVYVDDTTPEVQRQGVYEAVAAWNYSLEAQVLEVVDLSGSSTQFMWAGYGSITVSQGELGTTLRCTEDDSGLISDCSTVHVLGSAERLWAPDGDYYHCMVLYDLDVDTVEVAVPVMIHELGHCLTLRHDYREDSIMFHSAVHSPDQRILPEHVAQVRSALP